MVSIDFLEDLGRRTREAGGLALVGVAGTENEADWSDGNVPAEHAIRGFHGVTPLPEDAAKTSGPLTGLLGSGGAGRDGSTMRYRTSDDAAAARRTPTVAIRYQPRARGSRSQHQAGLVTRMQ